MDQRRRVFSRVFSRVPPLLFSRVFSRVSLSRPPFLKLTQAPPCFSAGWNSEWFSAGVKACFSAGFPAGFSAGFLSRVGKPCSVSRCTGRSPRRRCGRRSARRRAWGWRTVTMGSTGGGARSYSNHAAKRNAARPRGMPRVLGLLCQNATFCSGFIRFPSVCVGATGHKWPTRGYLLPCR